MTQLFSFKSAAMLCVATLAMCFAGQEASAQCGGGGFSRGFGGGGYGTSYSSGFRGPSNFGVSRGFGGYGGSYSSYRPTYSRSVGYGSSQFSRYGGRSFGNYYPSRSRYGYGYGGYYR